MGKNVEDVEDVRDILFKEGTDPGGTPVEGYDFNTGFDVDTFLNAFKQTGMQASELGDAMDMFHLIQEKRRDEDLTLFFGYTSNMVSSGNREILRFLAEEQLVDVLVTTGGGVEEDIIKCEQDFYRGRFDADGEELRERGINRIGNLYAPNQGYVFFEAFMQDLLEDLHKEQRNGATHPPSTIIHRMGEKIDDEDSIYYWAAKHNIPVYCPTFTDGAIGDNIFLYHHQHDDFTVDIAADIDDLTMHAVKADQIGLTALGAGPAKHHICNAAMLGGGATHTLYVSTGKGWMGSDSGAPPAEARSWGKVKAGTEAVKVYCDATIAFPLIVAGALETGRGTDGD